MPWWRLKIVVRTKFEWSDAMIHYFVVSDMTQPSIAGIANIYEFSPGYCTMSGPGTRLQWHSLTSQKAWSSTYRSRYVNKSPLPPCFKIWCNHLENVMATLLKCGHCPTQRTTTEHDLYTSPQSKRRLRTIAWSRPQKRLRPFLIGMSAHVKIT